MKTNGNVAVTFGAVVLFATAISLGVSEARANNLVSRSQLRRTEDPSDRAATGSIVLQKNPNGTQIVDVDVTGLGVDSFALFITELPTFSTNCCVHSVSPLNRVNEKKGTWTRHLTGHGVAPPELQANGIFDLSSLDGMRADISSPVLNNLIQPVTNVFGCVTNITATMTNIVFGMTNIVAGTTNVTGCTSNIIVGIAVPTPGETNLVGSILWAPLYAPMLNPGSRSYVRRAKILPPDDDPPPSPGASAKISVKFNGGDGRSIFDVRARNLTPGQVYHLFIADSTNQNTYVLIEAGTMTPNKSGKMARFIRDTKFADPLPQQVRDAGDLSHRAIQIRDDFGFFIHLDGVIP